jgi:TolB-like protein
MSIIPRSVRTAGLCSAVAALLAGCASATLEARPEQIPALEQATAASPGDTDTATRLGIAYFLAGRHEDSRRTLGSAIEAGATEGAAYLYLGLANEELEDYVAARAAYDRYLRVGTSSRVTGEIRGRLALVARKELQQQARVALQQERVLSDQPPTPRTIAVLPFRMSGLSEELQPLQTALADMIITDLGLSNALQSLERVRVQSLVDEMLLTQAGFTTQETGARMGRMLKAEHVVQGSITGAGNEIIVGATVLGTESRQTRGEVSQSGVVDAIFDIEKRVVFGILDALNIQLTASEREAITNNRTSNLVAFLTYGRGLQALDRGDYNEALSQFRQSTSADPGFGAARAQQVETQLIGDASVTTPDQIGAVGMLEISPTGAELTDIVNQVNFSPAATLSQQTQAVTAQVRKPATEQTNTSSLGQAQTATIRIIITPPGGGN